VESWACLRGDRRSSWWWQSCVPRANLPMVVAACGPSSGAGRGRGNSGSARRRLENRSVTAELRESRRADPAGIPAVRGPTSRCIPSMPGLRSANRRPANPLPVAVSHGKTPLMEIDRQQPLGVQRRTAEFGGGTWAFLCVWDGGEPRQWLEPARSDLSSICGISFSSVLSISFALFSYSKNSRNPDAQFLI
jgi:hypothetical protein